MRIHYLQHVPFEGLGNIEEWIRARGYPVSVTRLYQGEALPNIADIDWLIVMGGPMGAYEEDIYPWITGEKNFISQSISAGKKVLGICLGAQLIASVLGARVFPNRYKEIGWYPLSLTADGAASGPFKGFPAEFMAFHWHGDTFDLPAGAKHLAESAACRNQAFSYRGNVLGLQFHLDLKKENVEQLILNCGSELQDSPFVEAPGQMTARTDCFEEAQGRMKMILEDLAASK
jgi:GMP synthase-like glutamine amidotransferase